MKFIEIVKKLPGDNFVCSICENSLFEIERIAPDKVRLTCENCGESHLLYINSASVSQNVLEFSCSEEERIPAF